MALRHIEMKDETIRDLKIFMAKKRFTYSQAIKYLVDKYTQEEKDGGENNVK